MPDLDFNLLPIDTPKMLESRLAYESYLKSLDESYLESLNQYISFMLAVPEGILNQGKDRGLCCPTHELSKWDY